MSKEIKKKIKYCIYCGANIDENKTYCPNCGKLVFNVQSIQKTTKPPFEDKIDISRKCSGCGSIINSSILEQCPICNTPLERLPAFKKAAIEKKAGLIFTKKKLEPEEKLILKKDIWNLKEGLNVFESCIYILIFAFFLIIVSLRINLDTTEIETNIQIILLSQVPETLFGFYAIWYIYIKKHDFKKLGLNLDLRKFVIALFVGVIGTSMLLLINILSNSFIRFISDHGWDFLKVQESINEENQILNDSEIIWIILLTILLCIGSISTEIVFRGVLHNSLIQRFENRYFVILLVAFVYSVIMLILSLPIGLFYIIPNFLSFLVLGFIYERTEGNLFSTIIANVFYNIVTIFLILL